MGNTRTVDDFQHSSGSDSRTPVDDSPKDAEREVEKSHEEYAKNAKITDKQAKDMQKRRETVVENLKKEGLEIVEDHIYGSVMQGTMTGPLDEDSDVDVLVVLDSNKYESWANDPNGPRNALESIRRKLNNKYRGQEVSVDRNVVAVKFSDFTVEVAPAFRYSDVRSPNDPTEPVTIGGMVIPIRPPSADNPNNGYAIPDTYNGQSWVGTNPRRFQSMYDAVNERSGGNLQKVAVSAKKWNEEKGKPVSSYHMVMMAYKYFQQDAPANTSTHEHMSNFFRNLPQYVSDDTKEPVYQEQVDKGMSAEEESKAVSKAYQASQAIEEAETLKNKGKTEEAKEKYQEVYGDDFN